VQRLPQVVARGGEELALRSIGAFGRRPRVDGSPRAGLQFVDQVDVLVAHCERARQHVVQTVTEADDECQHDAHHAGNEHVDRIADERHAHDQRHECGQHEAVERRLERRRQIEPAERGAEQAHDQQRLIRGRLRKHHDRRGAPERAGDRRADGPISAPPRGGCRARPDARKGAHQRRSPRLVQRDQRAPRRHPRRRHLRPHRGAQDQRAERHRQRRQVAVRVERRDLIRARTRDERWRDRLRGHRPTGQDLFTLCLRCNAFVNMV
jgi:hypothetical protein